MYLAGELLKAEGFTDVRYVQGDEKVDQAVWIARGETDFSMNYAPVHVASIDAGVPIKVLGGLHSGCLELIANDSVEGISDLKGKRVGMHDIDAPSRVLVALMAAYIGLDPNNDFEWVQEASRWKPSPKESSMHISSRRRRRSNCAPRKSATRSSTRPSTALGRSISAAWFLPLRTTSNRYPVATKRVLRAIVKGADLCASDPAWSAGQMVERGFVHSYEYALQTLSDTRYDVWRDYDPEASVRFYALRMQETGMIKSSPQEIIANGTDWRFVNELKRELKT